MRREIDNENASAGPEHARGFGDGGLRVVEIVQHLVKERGVEASVRCARGERHAEHVGEPHLTMLDARARKTVARDGQHFRAHIDADTVPDLRRQQFEHPAGAGARIEQRLHRLQAQHGRDGGFNILLRRVQRADALPIGGVCLEESRSFGGARFAHGRQAPAVRRQRVGLAFRKPREDMTQLRARPLLRRAIEHPASFLEAQDQPGIAQQFEVAGDARLALAQDLGQLGDGQLRLPQDQQQAQPGRIGSSTQHGQQFVHPDLPFVAHINISLYDYANRKVAGNPRNRW